MLEPDDGILAIGSGGNFALAAARAMIGVAELDAEAVARKAMDIAAGICVYTNGHVTVESIAGAEEPRDSQAMAETEAGTE